MLSIAIKVLTETSANSMLITNLDSLEGHRQWRPGWFSCLPDLLNGLMCKYNLGNLGSGHKKEMEIARRKRGMVNICLRIRTERERDGKKKAGK